jgi:HSP20 family protein
MAKEEHSTIPVEVRHKGSVARHPRHFYEKRLRHLFHDEMERMFEQMLEGWMPPLHRMFEHMPAWPGESSFVFADPAVEVTEDDRAYTITAEVPGREQKDIEVSLSSETLTLKGERREETEEKETGVYIFERAYGSFQRSFDLPNGVDREKITAHLANGVLKVTLPKTEEAQKLQKKIEVKAAA